ncbi:MAG TPA: hypothetical protein VFW33_08315 [Gemmataceae bacterium]|nr:hypothetical protein [Gemmataceae bacterium]
MFRFLGIVAVAFGVAALASLAPTPATKTPAKNNLLPPPPPPRPTFARIPGLTYHLAFSMN